MTDTFAFNPPALVNSAPTFPLPNEGYPPAYTAALSLNHTQRLESYRAAHANQPEHLDRTAELDDGRGRLPARRMTEHSLPEANYKLEQYVRAGSISPKPNQVNDGANYPSNNTAVRTTRPMTAPSSVSAPYYYSSNQLSSFYPPPAPLFSYPTQQMPNGADAFQHYRTNIMQTGLPGGRGGMQEQPRYGDRREAPLHDIHDSTFMHAPPPLPRPNPPYYDTPTRVSTDEITPEQRSRPATAESRPNSARRNLDQNFSSRPSQSNDDSAYIPTPDDEPAPSRSRGFASAAGKASKRPRRRYDEIERIYTCDYPGCEKAYGTLNHLNSHKTMQKHGPKSTPAQFKELRKAWRDSKKAAATAAPRPPPAAESISPPSHSPPPSLPPAPLRRPVTASADFAYQVPTQFPPPLTSYAPPPNLTNHQYSLDGASWDTSIASSTYDYSYQLPPSPHRPVTAPSYLHNAPMFGFGSSHQFMVGSGFPTLSGANGNVNGLQGLRRASLPGNISSGGFYGGGDETFGIIQEEAPTYSHEEREREEAVKNDRQHYNQHPLLRD